MVVMLLTKIVNYFSIRNIYFISIFILSIAFLYSRYQYSQLYIDYQKIKYENTILTENINKLKSDVAEKNEVILYLNQQLENNKKVCGKITKQVIKNRKIVEEFINNNQLYDNKLRCNYIGDEDDDIKKEFFDVINNFNTK